MKCPTPRCPEKLATHSKRLYCKNCRDVNEILARVKLATTYLMQAEHKMTKPYSEAELYSLLALRVLTIKGS